MTNQYRRGMQRKTIRKILNAKLEDWVKSIKDENVVALIRKNAIVTGGSIATLLIGEPVNDYDIYFRDKATTIAVANYYVDWFNELHGGIDAKGTRNDHTPEVKEEKIKNCKGVEEERVTIRIKSAGVASEEMEEYQYFESATPEEAHSFAESLKIDLIEQNEDGSKPQYRPIFMSQNAITLSQKVQLVIRFFGSPSQIHDNYDFAHAKCYYDWGTGELDLPAESLECLLSRTLKYRGSLYPIASIFRTKKFVERGWHISAGDQLKIMWQINELDLKDPAVLREQLTGVDAAYMWQLIHALEGVDPERWNSAYIAEIIDRIF